MPWTAFDAALSAEQFKSLVQVLKAVPDVSDSCSIFICVLGSRIKAASVVNDSYFKLCGGNVHVHANPRGAAVFERVVQRFLKGQKQIMARLGGKRMVRQSARNMQFAFHGCVLQIFGGILPEVSSQMLQSVIVRIHGPDDFVQRLQ